LPVGRIEQRLEDRLSPDRLVRTYTRENTLARPRSDTLVPMEDVMDKLLLTPVEAAAVLGIGRSKLYELLQTGQLASVRIGTCRRVPADAVHSFLLTLRSTAPS
jgi:excisionase family DNA binding protein